ncbi:hypothetical protein EDD22DRAFT_951379 [Suillus occidentalis]|nr:hypothetical protein EDD22DRAFT_951379 [Suillus occidentalis]
MPFPNDGIYTIKNLGRDLMLDLKNNSTAEGNQIQGYARNGTVAQQWMIKRQNEAGLPQQDCQHSVQQQRQQWKWMLCHRERCMLDWPFILLFDSEEPVVYTRQAFIVDLIGRMDDTYTMSFTLGNSNLVLSIPSAKHSDVKLENFVEGSARQQWEFTRVSDLQPIR